MSNEILRTRSIEVQQKTKRGCGGDERVAVSKDSKSNQ